MNMNVHATNQHTEDCKSNGGENQHEDLTELVHNEEDQVSAQDKYVQASNGERASPKNFDLFTRYSPMIM